MTTRTEINDLPRDESLEPKQAEQVKGGLNFAVGPESPVSINFTKGAASSFSWGAQGALKMHGAGGGGGAG